VPFRVEPMLATRVDGPVHRRGWVYEEKYDGYRILAYKEGAKVTLLSRSGNDLTRRFADVAGAVAKLHARTAVLDGEVVAFDDDLVSRFQLLQQGKVPLLYAVFDCLWLDGRDLRREPLPVRRAAFERLIEGSDRLFPSRRLAADGLVAHRQAVRSGYEGLLAKDPTAPYVSGRTRRWLKVKVQREEEFVVGGFTAPAGTRSHLGALLLGAYAGRDLRYVGRVGTGFTQRMLAAVHALLRPLVRPSPPFVDPPRLRGVTWVEPRLVAQVSFQEWTHDRQLRAPVFLGLRDDKDPREVRLADAGAPLTPAADRRTRTPPARRPRRA
jgi:bifunctional non-homologous end joining protein LigD